MGVGLPTLGCSKVPPTCTDCRASARDTRKFNDKRLHIGFGMIFWRLGLPQIQSLTHGQNRFVCYEKVTFFAVFCTFLIHPSFSTTVASFLNLETQFWSLQNGEFLQISKLSGSSLCDKKWGHGRSSNITKFHEFLVASPKFDDFAWTVTTSFFVTATWSWRFWNLQELTIL